MLQPRRNVTLAGGKYELIEEIGRGGMGSVWCAHAVLLDRPCAIKFLRPDAADPLSRERLLNEARAAARISSPHTVTIFDVDFSEGLPFIAMELLSGETLGKRLQKGELFPRLTCEVIQQVARGLSHAHAANLVHRDLKPDNIFVVQENPLLVKLLDFGTAKNAISANVFRTGTGYLIGTPHYMSPEQAAGKPIDLRSDVWALGVVTYRCLTGRVPFDGETWAEVLVQIMRGEIPPLSDAARSFPASVERGWSNVMQRDPAARPGSALEFAAGLERALEREPPERVLPAPITESATRLRREDIPVAPAPPRRRALGLALLGVCTLALVATLAWLLHPKSAAIKAATPRAKTLPSQALSQAPTVPAPQLPSSGGRTRPPSPGTESYTGSHASSGDAPPDAYGSSQRVQGSDSRPEATRGVAPVANPQATHLAVPERDTGGDKPEGDSLTTENARRRPRDKKHVRAVGRNAGSEGQQLRDDSADPLPIPSNDPAHTPERPPVHRPGFDPRWGF